MNNKRRNEYPHTWEETPAVGEKGANTKDLLGKEVLESVIQNHQPRLSTKGRGQRNGLILVSFLDGSDAGAASDNIPGVAEEQ